MNAPIRIGHAAEQLLEELADSLQVPPERREAAERSYQSLAAWLNRSGSALAYANPQVYVQGSFRLGTAIRPSTTDGQYDIDLVCELDLSKASTTQAKLKAALGEELKAYSRSKGMQQPSEGRRCWTQDYRDEARFHMDTLPAIQDGARNRLLLETAGYSAQWADTAIAITDRDHPHYNTLSADWPHSNPKGYANWFQSRMAAIFRARRQFLALEARASVEEIPEHRVRTPLQSAIQILKHHRDQMFADRCNDAPISIIITTLAALSYGQEPTIGGAIYSILQRMDAFIEDRAGVKWIPNPTDGAENFADRWEEHPEREDAFYEWLSQAREDFTRAALAQKRSDVLEALEPRLRSRLTASVFESSRPSLQENAFATMATVRQLLNPAHKKSPPWAAVGQGTVTIGSAIVSRNGFRPEVYTDGAGELPKGCCLEFLAHTSVPAPFNVFWQVVNTGYEAERAGCLRGGFNEGSVTPGKLSRKESTLYSGTHSIECFIVKGGYLAARSGQFIVKIA